MLFHRLQSVDGVIAFDSPDAAHSSGGTRLALGVDEREVALLAPAMTYKFAVLRLRIGGANTPRDIYLRRYLEEIRPLVLEGRFSTGPDLGTVESSQCAGRPPHFGAATYSNRVRRWLNAVAASPTDRLGNRIRAESRRLGSLHPLSLDITSVRR
jgi:Glu/Leu/Phe/Val dehydrogenase, dimerisation domain